MVSRKETKSCYDCKFYDGRRNHVCMYKYEVRAILDESKTAQNCKNYIEGKFDLDELEKTNYQ